MIVAGTREYVRVVAAPRNDNVRLRADTPAVGHHRGCAPSWRDAVIVAPCDGLDARSGPSSGPAQTCVAWWILATFIDKACGSLARPSAGGSRGYLVVGDLSVVVFW